MSHLRTFLLKLLVSSTALLACACAGFVVDAGAAQSPRTARSVRSATPIARAAAHSAKGRHARGASRKEKARNHGARSRISHAARNRSARRVRTLRHQAAAVHHASSTSSTTVSVASQASASIANVLATPCENTELTPTAQNIQAIDGATLCLVNQERARNNELPLQPNAQLEQAAQGHSEEMVSDNYFAHVAPGGLTPVARVQETGYVPNQQVGYTLGENIAWGTLSLSTPAAIVAAWIASPEHLANILYSSYRDTAIGVTPAAPASLGEGQPGAVYSQDFGVIVG